MSTPSLLLRATNVRRAGDALSSVRRDFRLAQRLEKLGGDSQRDSRSGGSLVEDFADEVVRAYLDYVNAWWEVVDAGLPQEALPRFSFLRENLRPGQKGFPTFQELRQRLFDGELEGQLPLSTKASD